MQQWFGLSVLVSNEPFLMSELSRFALGKLNFSRLIDGKDNNERLRGGVGVFALHDQRG